MGLDKVWVVEGWWPYEGDEGARGIFLSQDDAIAAVNKTGQYGPLHPFDGARASLKAEHNDGERCVTISEMIVGVWY